jgi:hypothetical protein
VVAVAVVAVMETKNMVVELVELVDIYLELKLFLAIQATQLLLAVLVLVAVQVAVKVVMADLLYLPQ